MKVQKAYKGMAMEGMIARWYAGITNHEVRHRQIAERLAGKIAAGSRVLEIAPGPGYFAIELARFGDFQITGLDISKSFVGIANENARRAGVRVDFQHGNAAAMPFADETFNFIFCQAAFKNFAEPVKVLVEIYRVLRPRYSALIIDLRGDASDAEIEHHIDSLKLSGINRFITQFTFHSFLLKNAYYLSEIRAFIAQTPFQKYHLEMDEIGFSLNLER